MSSTFLDNSLRKSVPKRASKPWFTAVPVGRNTLTSMFRETLLQYEEAIHKEVTLSEHSEPSQNYFNNCIVRTSSVST